MKLIRWGAVGPLLGLIFLITVFVVFFLDSVARWAIIRGGEAVFGARVEIGSVSVKLGQSALFVNRMAVADKSAPMQNLFEFNKSAFDLSALPLLEKKIIIDQASVTGLRFGTPRKTSGALPFVEKKPGFVGKAVERLSSQVEDFALGKLDAAKQFVDPKTVVNPQALKSLKAGEQAKATLSESPKALENDLKSLNAEERARELKARVAAVGKGGSGLEGALKTAEDVKRLQTDIRAFQADLEKTKQTMTSRIETAKNAVADVKKARDEDWAQVKSLVSLPSLDKESIARSVFGPSVVSQVERLLGYVHTARQYMPAKAAAPPPPPRGQGRTIEFPRYNVLPRFLLKKAQLTGEVGQEKPLAFDGTLADITSNPTLWGRPAVALVKGGQGSRLLNARIVMDHTKETPREEFQGQYSGFAIGNKTVGQEGSLTLALSQGTGVAHVDVGINGNQLNGKLAFGAQQLNVQPSITLGSNSPLGQRLTQNLTSSLSRVKSLDVGVGLNGTLTSPAFTVTSNIGSLVADAMKNALGAEVAQQEQALRAELNKHTDGVLKQLDSQVADLQSQFLGPVASNNKIAEDLLLQLKGKVLGGTGSSQPFKDLKNIFGR